MLCRTCTTVQYVLITILVNFKPKIVLNMTACDQNSNCMIHCYKSYPGISKVEKHLKEYFQLTDKP